MIYVPGASLRGTRQSDVEPEAPWHLARRSLPRLDHKYLNNTFATSKFAIIISMSRDRALKVQKHALLSIDRLMDRPAAGEKIH